MYEDEGGVVVLFEEEGVREKDGSMVQWPARHLNDDALFTRQKSFL